MLTREEATCADDSCSEYLSVQHKPLSLLLTAQTQRHESASEMATRDAKPTTASESLHATSLPRSGQETFLLKERGKITGSLSR